MNKRVFVSAAVSAALALAVGGSAMAADIHATGAGHAKHAGFDYVDRNGSGTVKDLVVEAGADPGAVVLHFAGAQKVEFGDVGTLKITRADGSIWRYKPSVYQMVDGKRKYMTVGFHMLDKDRVSLKLVRFDASAPLVVGPVDGRNGNS